jgi:GDP-mannose pyrophosphatase NudK
MEEHKLLTKKRLYSNFIHFEELVFEIPEKKQQIRRFVVDRPAAAAILLFNTETQSVILIRQFRAPLYLKNDAPFTLEVPAGVLENDENPLDCIIRETWEESGYRIEKPTLIYSFYPSPGVFGEKMYLFYKEVNKQMKRGSGGGLESEKEYLDVLEIPRNNIPELLGSGKILDAKTIIALQFLIHTSKA